MKKLIVCLILLTLYSCSSSIIGKRFVYYNSENESDLELIFNKDSTFTLKDEYGCKRMSQKGNWLKMESDEKTFFLYRLILFDSTKPSVSINLFGKKIYTYKSNCDGKIYTIKEDSYFPLISKDTITIMNSKNIIFRGLYFFKFKGNIEEVRIINQEKEFIKKFGKKAYIQTIGQGISVTKARESLKECK
jgi:hypothetical protein